VITRGGLIALPITKPYNRLVISAIVLIVLVCLALTIVKPAGVAHREKTRKENAVNRIIDYIGYENAALQKEELKTISEMVYGESIRCNVDYRLILALMKIESNFRYDAVSRRGARGLLQVKPSFARYIAEDAGIRWRGDKTLDEPEENIRIGVHFFSTLINDFKSINMALHAYHVGPTRLREILTKKKEPEKRYLNLVLDEYDRNISLLPAP
jgi:soluble lytic murein transglycosylase